MASDPFATTPEQGDRPLEVRLSLKPSGSYDASMISVQGTPEKLAELLKVEVSPEDTRFNILWKVSLRWNDLARAVQADEAKKQASAGKA
jgi:hypothetical protein